MPKTIFDRDLNTTQFCHFCAVVALNIVLNKLWMKTEKAELYFQKVAQNGKMRKRVTWLHD